MRYETVLDEDFVRYASFERLEVDTALGPVAYWNKDFELLSPGTELSNRKIQALEEQFRNGMIRSVIIKWSICFAEYYNSIEGWTHHKVLHYSDFDVQKEDERGWYRFEDRLGREFHKRDYRALAKLYEKAAKPKSQHGSTFVEEIEIKFGPKLPMDYYGDYDYDPLGGYTGFDD